MVYRPPAAPEILEHRNHNDHNGENLGMTLAQLYPASVIFGICLLSIGGINPFVIAGVLGREYVPEVEDQLFFKELNLSYDNQLDIYSSYDS